MRRVLAATLTKLAELKTVRIIAAILLSCVIALLALITLKSNHRTNIFFFDAILTYQLSLIQ